MQYTYLFQGLKSAPPAERAKVLETVRKIMKLPMTPKCKLVLGADSFYL